MCSKQDSDASSPLLPYKRNVIPSVLALTSAQERSTPAQQFSTGQGNLTLAQPQQSCWKTPHLQPQIILQLKVRCCSKTGQESYPQHSEAGAEKPAPACIQKWGTWLEQAVSSTQMSCESHTGCAWGSAESSGSSDLAQRPFKKGHEVTPGNRTSDTLVFSPQNSMEDIY